MSDLLVGDIASVGDFLAHALEMEVESAERYRELADNMEVHNNPEVAALFHRLAVESDVHVKQVQRLAATTQLPDIAPWAFKWSSPDGPESATLDEVHYLMTRCQALRLALHNETRGLAFYRQIAERSSAAPVRQLAGEMAGEEEDHVAMLRSLLCRAEEEAASRPLADLDPPNTPE
jgi:rubrerythrin